jgi:CO/xanthine dehydrogenase FAD-binding subunit
MMYFRGVHPSQLIDLNRISALSYIRVEGGELRIGAMTRHCEVERSRIIQDNWPLLAGVMRHVAHVQIRSRGTIGGSLSHADPAAELPAVVSALDGKLVLRSATDTRILNAEDFFVGALTTAAEPGELLIEVRIPALPKRTTWAFDELSRRKGDFAIVGVAAIVRCEPSGIVDFVRLAFTGVDEKSVRSREAEAFLMGNALTDANVAEAARLAATKLHPSSDVHASAQYRMQVAEVMAQRVLTQALREQKDVA